MSSVRGLYVGILQQETDLLAAAFPCGKCQLSTLADVKEVTLFEKISISGKPKDGRTMSGMRKKLIVVLSAVIVCFSSARSVCAEANLSTPARYYNGIAYYEIASSTDWNVISRETTDMSPAILYTFYTGWVTFKDGKAYVTGADAKNAETVIEASENWLEDNMPSIVPDGTERDTALNLICSWIRKRMTYQHTVNEQSALPCFTEGTGNCATYAAAFDSMVHYLPFKDGTVDYTNGADHLAVLPVFSRSHCWSGVQMDGEWFFFDLTWYDSSGDSKWIWAKDPTFGEEEHHTVMVF